MNITKQQINGIWCKVYKPVTPSNNWIIWLHGIGEENQAGINDGSQLDKIEITGVWPTFAKNGTEFPFNIIAPQIDNGTYSDWWRLTSGTPGNEAWFINYVKETLNASTIGVTGYSLGGRGCWNFLKYDTKKYINFMSPVCGYYDFGNGAISNLRTVPVYGVHGDKDTTMIYSYDTATRDAYNVNRPTQKVNGVDQPSYYLVTVPGAGHNVWGFAYDLTTGKDGLYQWTLQQFGMSEVVTPPAPTIYPATVTFDGTDFIATANGVSKKLITK